MASTADGAYSSEPVGREFVVDTLRLLVIVCSLVAFSCIASVKDYASSSALTFSLLVGVVLWLWSMIMFGIGISLSTLHAKWVSEGTYGWMSRNGDALILLLTYTAAICVSVISSDMGTFEPEGTLRAGCVFLWFSTAAVGYQEVFKRGGIVAFLRSEGSLHKKYGGKFIPTGNEGNNQVSQLESSL